MLKDNRTPNHDQMNCLWKKWEKLPDLKIIVIGYYFFRPVNFNIYKNRAWDQWDEVTRPSTNYCCNLYVYEYAGAAEGNHLGGGGGGGTG